MTGIELQHGMYQRHYLSNQAKIALKHLMSLEQKLREPGPPYSAKGLVGLRESDELLRQRDAKGILIGGIAEAVWNLRRKPDQLSQHKDVDVMVLDEYFKLTKDFEKGIDWWVPETGRITIRSDVTDYERDKTWWANGNGVVLGFGIEQRHNLKPGLYIPSHEWIINMREYEVNANIDYKRINIEIDDEAFDDFRSKLKRKIRTKVPKFIRDIFTGRILDRHYEPSYSRVEAIRLIEFDFETVTAINRFRLNI